MKIAANFSSKYVFSNHNGTNKSCDFLNKENMLTGHPSYFHDGDEEKLIYSRFTICNITDEPFSEQNIFDTIENADNILKTTKSLKDAKIESLQTGLCQMTPNDDDLNEIQEKDKLQMLFSRENAILKNRCQRKDLIDELLSNESKNKVSLTHKRAITEDQNFENPFFYLHQTESLMLFLQNKKMIDFMLFSGSQCKVNKLDEFPTLKMKSSQIKENTNISHKVIENRTEAENSYDRWIVLFTVLLLFRCFNLHEYANQIEKSISMLY